MIGAGHGSAFLRLLAERLISEGASAVAIDPDVENRRARRAYEKAGFSLERVVDAGEGPVAVMRYRLSAPG
jgi:aminoglycoside 6'-N-acetyltransferase